jgi:glucosamine--fructose-6-phosphate aminotransferase (isomerizing)
MSDTPELRPGPPWAMEEMILAEPGLVGPILASPAIADAAALVRTAGDPLILTGCGTSEHAAMAGAALLGGGSRDAFEASLDPQRGGVLIAVSHEGETAATLAALQAADAGKILVTACPEHVGALADDPLIVATPLRDTSWCHTVGYLSPLLTFAALAGFVDPAPISAAIEGMLARREAIADAARVLHGCERLIVAAGGVDEVTARELALKIEEGAHVPVTPLGIEKLLHGHLPAADARTGLIVLRLDRRNAEQRDKRASDAIAAASELAMPTVVLRDLPETSLPPVPAALIAGALAAQLLTLELVLAAGTNPDLIRREEEPYRAAAAAAST